MFKVCRLYSSRRYKSPPSSVSTPPRKRAKHRAIAHLDLDVEHRLRVDLEPERALDPLREPLLVALLHRRPALLELRAVDVLEQTLDGSDGSVSMPLPLREEGDTGTPRACTSP